MSTLTLKERILEKDKEFHGKPDILSMTGLTNPAYISASRSVMFTSHLTQFVNLINPEFPKVFHHMENIVGEYSTGYYKTKGKIKVVHKIPKFGIGEYYDKMYVLIVYDEDKDEYDIITKVVAEDLTEKFGYSYNTDVLDKIKVGDTIKKDTVLYKSLSYDEDMNYGFGRNVRVLYTEDPYTIEDAIICSQSFVNKMACNEIETVKLSINDNDILCNIYGEENNYKCFPDIGEYIKGNILAVKRRIHNNQLLYDIKKSNLRKINYSSDKIIYSSGKIIDMTIYCNKPIEDIPDNMFNLQLKSYLEMQNYFYEKIKEVCEEIVESGSKYTSNVTWYYKKATDVLDPETLWNEENYSVFSNMVVEFMVERVSPLAIGQKITGRQGNKGVIAQIWSDDKMPFSEDGKRVDIMVNALGVIGRLNPMQIFEQSINHIGNAVRKKLAELSSDEEREKLLFDIIDRFNHKQCKHVKSYYTKLKNKDSFWEEIYEHGIYIHIVPIWEEKPLFDVLREIYKDYEWIKPETMYINKFGRKIKIMKPLIVSEIYMMRLKQDSKKGFSARSTGALNKKGMPDKSNKSKKHEDLYSSTPIRIGDQENMNMMIGMPSELISKLHTYYRNDPELRQYTVNAIMSNPTEPIEFKECAQEYNKNVAELKAYLKAMGYEIIFDEDQYNVNYDWGISGKIIGDEYVIGFDSDIKDAEMKQEIVDQYKSGQYAFVGTNDEWDEMIEMEFQEKKAQSTNDQPDEEF